AAQILEGGSPVHHDDARVVTRNPGGVDPHGRVLGTPQHVVAVGEGSDAFLPFDPGSRPGPSRCYRRLRRGGSRERVAKAGNGPNPALSRALVARAPPGPG